MIDFRGVEHSVIVLSNFTFDRPVPEFIDPVYEFGHWLDHPMSLSCTQSKLFLNSRTCTDSCSPLASPPFQLQSADAHTDTDNLGSLL